MPSGSDVYSPGNLRYFRLGSILQVEGKLAVRSYFEKTYLLGNTFPQYLGQASVKTKLYKLKIRKILTNEQYEKLYPTTGDADLETLDISLLYLLMRALHPVFPPHDPVWTNPQPGNKTEEADVSRITQTRNRMWGHSGTIELSENEFQSEASDLELVITRLARSVSNPYVDAFKLTDSIKNRISANFDPTPLKLEMAVSTTDSLEREGHDAGETKVDVSTSMTSLQQRRKLSCRIRRCLNSLIPGSREQNEHVALERTQLLHCRPKTLRRNSSASKHSSRSTQSANVSCMPLKCITKRHRRKYCTVSNFNTSDHKEHACRCSLGGVTRLRNGVTVVTDTAHNSLQAFDVNNDLICDREIASPRGVCSMSDDTVIVGLSKSNTLYIFRVDNGMHYVDDVSVQCEGWLCDVKYVNGCAYVLCDKGDIHVVNIDKCTEERLSLDLCNKAEFFDVSSSGDHDNDDDHQMAICQRTLLFVSDGRGVVCFDDSGAELWQYRGGRSGISTTGVVSLPKGRVIVAAWESQKLVELTHDGTWVRNIGVGHLERPLAIGTCGREVLVTQYMSELKEDLCREVVILRD